MRRFEAIICGAVLGLAGCEFRVPLADARGLPLDAALIGQWECVEENGEAKEDALRLLILKFAPGEYLVRSRAGSEEGMYYRGYPIEVGGKACVQLQLIGVKGGPPDADKKDIFHVFTYEIVGDQLRPSFLDDTHVSRELETTEALAAAFLANKDKEDLFAPLCRFRRLQP